MNVKTKFGEFKIIKDYKNAWDITLFEEKYVDVAFDRYNYLVGDLIVDDTQGSRLRMKGFSKNLSSSFSFKTIPDYLTEFCNFDVPFFIIKRLSNKENVHQNPAEEVEVHE
ncbi:MAG: DUF1027 domain-containing protein [Acholeplasmatales bacterium]|jgi:uncharacterized protein YutD|nr:DUF1027 domain-containing protein [Acholeplasmatales bacterium]